MALSLFPLLDLIKIDGQSKKCFLEKSRGVSFILQHTVNEKTAVTPGTHTKIERNI